MRHVPKRRALPTLRGILSPSPRRLADKRAPFSADLPDECLINSQSKLSLINRHNNANLLHETINDYSACFTAAVDAHGLRVRCSNSHSIGLHKCALSVLICVKARDKLLREI